MASTGSNIASEAVAAAAVSAGQRVQGEANETPSVPSTDVEQWTLTEVCGWLQTNGVPYEVEESFREHEVTHQVWLVPQAQSSRGQAERRCTLIAANGCIGA